MKFENSLKEGYAKKIPKNINRAKSILESAEQAMETAKEIPLTEKSAKTILRELYESLREFCEAIGYVRGYKFKSHKSITFFIKDILGDENLSKKFDRYRKLRNGINYYAENIDVETVKNAMKEIPLMAEELKNFADMRKKE